ncbi:MAG: hypothetical protein PHC33_00410 [Candidatus Omnitrophica bacterium]|nr:hypothetical protein [Candidatus Omnitrophota bacterium]
MKYANALLTLIAVFLLLIVLRLSGFEVLAVSCKDSNQALADAQRALVSSNQRLEDELVNLREKIAGLEERLLKK